MSVRRIIKPPAIFKGDTVGVIAPSDGLNAAERRYLERAVELIKSWGLKVKLGKHLFLRVADFMAGSAAERQADLCAMINDPKVRVIWAAKGGYAATEILPAFTPEIIEKLRSNPKWLIGYSDVCVLLNAFTSLGIANIHGPTLWDLVNWDKTTGEWLKDMLFGARGMEIKSSAHWIPIIPGEAKGTLLVSNLDCLATAFGTRFDPLLQGRGPVILGLEEVGEEKSVPARHIDALLNHKRSDRIKGIILGRLVNIEEYAYPRWGRKVEVEYLVEERIRAWREVPLAILSDFGHHAQELRLLQRRETFYSLPNGVKARLTLDDKGGRLRFLEPIVEKA